MFITAVCVLFLIKLRWPKNKSIYDKVGMFLSSLVVSSVEADHLPIAGRLQFFVKNWQVVNALPNKLFFGTRREARRRRGRPRNTWRRNTDHTIQSRGLSWHQLERLSMNRGDWRDFVSGLCSEMEYLKASDQIRDQLQTTLGYFQQFQGTIFPLQSCHSRIFFPLSKCL